MAKNIFIVDAFQVTSAGAFQHIANFPKSFNSESYEGNVDLALKRAKGAFHKQVSDFCNVDNFKIAQVTMTDIAGNQLKHEVVGVLTDEVTPVQEGEPEAE